MARENFNRIKVQDTKVLRDRARTIRRHKRESAIKNYLNEQKNSMGIEEPKVLDAKGRRELKKQQAKIDKKARIQKFREEKKAAITEE